MRGGTNPLAAAAAVCFWLLGAVAVFFEYQGAAVAQRRLAADLAHLELLRAATVPKAVPVPSRTGKEREMSI